MILPVVTLLDGTRKGTNQFKFCDSSGTVRTVALSYLSEKDIDDVLRAMSSVPPLMRGTLTEKRTAVRELLAGGTIVKDMAYQITPKVAKRLYNFSQQLN
jgi:hypothetical protein